MESKEDYLKRRSTAFVIFSKKKERFFWKYKNGRLYTAWSLAGAKHFLTSDKDRVIAICEDMEKRKLEPMVSIIGEIL